MDPNPMPWRAIDATGATPPEPDERGAWSRRPVGALAIAAAGGLILVATFLLAFGSGASGSVEVQAGGVLAPAPGVPSMGAGGDRGGAPSASVGEVPPDLVVEIVGAVVRPGVYHVPAGARVGDLVQAAGGYGPRVDADAASRTLNLAARLSDGDQVRVPARGDPVSGGVGATDGAPGGGTSGQSGGGGATVPLDLNAATSAELEALPGVGPATATKIIASRASTRFASVDDLRTRKLVGQKTFDGLRDLVTVR